MTLLSAFNAPDRGLSRFVREVRQILTANEGGMRWADNIGPLVTYRALGTAVDTRVKVSVSRAPLAVLCLSAKSESGFVNTGNQVGWTWGNGAIVVSSITNLAGVEYEITLGLLMG